MQCECCQQHEATIHVTQVVNGASRELHLCESCAEESGLNVQGVMALPEALFGMATPSAEDQESAARSCPACHLRGADFKKTGRLGCPQCYRTFAREMASMLSAMHKGTRHAGKVPGHGATVPLVADHTGRREELRRQLDEAVRAEQFEEAARLRDQLKELEHDGG